MKLEQEFGRLADDIIGMCATVPDRRKLKSWLVDRVCKVYETGRASMLLETHLRESLSQFAGKPLGESQEQIKAAVMKRIQLWEGLVDPEWEPQIEVIQGDDPHSFHVVPKDERTARIMRQMQDTSAGRVKQ